MFRNDTVCADTKRPIALSITHHKIVTDNLESMYLLFITKSKTEHLRKGETISLLNKNSFSPSHHHPGLGFVVFFGIVLLKVLQCYDLPTVLKNWYGSFQDAILHEILCEQKSESN